MACQLLPQCSKVLGIFLFLGLQLSSQLCACDFACPATIWHETRLVRPTRSSGIADRICSSSGVFSGWGHVLCRTCNEVAMGSFSNPLQLCMRRQGYQTVQRAAAIKATSMEKADLPFVDASGLSCLKCLGGLASVLLFRFLLGGLASGLFCARLGGGAGLELARARRRGGLASGLSCRVRLAGLKSGLSCRLLATGLASRLLFLWGLRSGLSLRPLLGGLRS